MNKYHLAKSYFQQIKLAEESKGFDPNVLLSEILKTAGEANEKATGDKTIHPLLREEMVDRYWKAVDKGMNQQEVVWATIQAMIFWPMDIKPIRSALEELLESLPKQPWSGATLAVNPRPAWNKDFFFL